MRSGDLCCVSILAASEIIDDFVPGPRQVGKRERLLYALAIECGGEARRSARGRFETYELNLIQRDVGRAGAGRPYSYWRER
jgi:hypothetical protein